MQEFYDVVYARVVWPVQANAGCIVYTLPLPSVQPYRSKLVAHIQEDSDVRSGLYKDIPRNNMAWNVQPVEIWSDDEFMDCRIVIQDSLFDCQ